MSEDRTYLIFAEKRNLSMDEGREQQVLLERRVLDIQDEGRVLEVLPT